MVCGAWYSLFENNMCVGSVLFCNQLLFSHWSAPYLMVYVKLFDRQDPDNQLKKEQDDHGQEFDLHKGINVCQLSLFRTRVFLRIRCYSFGWTKFKPDYFCFYRLIEFNPLYRVVSSKYFLLYLAQLIWL